MRDAILNFSKQFKYRPKIEGGKVKKYKSYLVAGMGGSHLAGDIIKNIASEVDIKIVSDYAPEKVEIPKTLIIASSYSGNTEEAVDWLNKSIQSGQPVVAIGIGGKVVEIAKQNGVPFIQLPDTGIQPRSALGYSMLAMMRIIKLNDLLRESKRFNNILKAKETEEDGRQLAQKLKDKTPVIYTSANNYSIAYNWKIKFNETGKIPAFYNVVPEVNHNEMTGFDVKEKSAHLSKPFHFIFIKDKTDHPQNIKRMEVTEKLYRDRGFSVESLELSGETKMEKIFNSLILADWTALHIAVLYDLESEQVPMVEEFKGLI